MPSTLSSLPGLGCSPRRGYFFKERIMDELELLLMFLPFLFGIGVGGPPPAPPSAPKPTEDSAAAAVLIAAASRGGFSDVPSDMRSWASVRMEEACDLIPKSGGFASLFRALSRHSVLQPLFWAKPKRAVFNSFIAEFFSCSILKRLDIRTAPVKIATAREACDQEDGVVKWFQPGNPNGVKYDPSMEKRLLSGEFAEGIAQQPCLVSTLVSGAASLSYLKDRFDLVKELPLRNLSVMFSERVQGLFTGSEMENWAEVNQQYESIVHKAIGKSCPKAYSFYFGYSPLNHEKIRAACAWDSPQFLKISAARVFLGCSAPHYSNVLCTQEGRLVSIDHCMVVTDNGESVRMIFEHTKTGTLAFDALRYVARLTEKDIQEAIAEVPRHPACGSPPDALERNLRAVRDYYIAQLTLWKKLLSEAEENADGSVVSLRNEREQQQQTV